MRNRVLPFDPHGSLPGSTVGPWLILERMDWGNFGIVYRACRAGHPDSPPVVVKMARWPGDARFEREVELLQHCFHPSIPRFEDAGVWISPGGASFPYVVMELVEGPTLYDWFRARQRTSRDVLKVLAQVAGALAAAHARGAVHRDVKGDNIRVTAGGRAVLVDWGSGWFAGARPLTDTTAPPGTTVYRPPEQRHFTWRFRMDTDARWQSQPTDDLYSLGVALYRMVTGTYLPPLSEGGEVAATREVPPPSDYATISMDLEALILRLLSNEREQRGTAEALAREAAALAAAAGDAAGVPIVPTASAESTDKGFSFPDGSEDEEVLSGTDSAPSSESSSSEEEEWRPSNELRAWLSWASAAMVGGLLVLFGAQLIRTISEQEPAPPWRATAEEVVQFAPDAGVGDEVLQAVEDLPSAGVSPSAIGREMPKQPFPGQRKPPCEPRLETEIMGACWVRVGSETSPCGMKMFDWGGMCFTPSFTAPRQPTSDGP
jgi:serine/threonine protein kinase